MDDLVVSKPFGYCDDWDCLFVPLLVGSEESTLPAAPNRPDETTSEREEISVPAQIRFKSVSSISVEFQMTIRSKRRIGPKQAAILLTVAAVEANEGPVYLQSYLALVFLLELCKTYLKSPNVNKDATKKAIALGETVLLALSGLDWVSLATRQKMPPEKELRIQKLSWYPNLRTYRSWTDYYVPARFLELKIVPLEQIQEHSENTEAYSGYTKGYHESGRGYRRDGMVYGEGKTPFDPEIDEDLQAPPVDLSSPIDEDPEYLRLTQAIQRAKERHRAK